MEALGDMARMILGMVAALGLMLLLAACAPDAPPSPTTEPLSLQIVHADPALAAGRFRRLLDFELPSDGVFIKASPSPAQITADLAHSGQAALAVPAGTQSLEVNLAGLLKPDQPLSDHWTLAGAYLHAPHDAQVMVQYEPGGPQKHLLLTSQPQPLPAGQWTGVFVDLTQQDAAIASRPPGTLRFVFAHPTQGRIGCDDVMLVDNTRVLAGGEQGTEGNTGWSVLERGQVLTLTAAHHRLIFPTPERIPHGWRLREANALRARLEQVDANGATLAFRTIYHDGRQYVDGRYEPLAAADHPDAAQAAQHDSPADVTVPDDMGRLIRNSPGDANNDGYNERRGAYQVLARGARIDITLSPRTPRLIHPILEITGLPPGQLLVTMEGQLIEGAVRTNEANVLVELPAPLERQTTINVRTK
jgi:hypothetical protein